MADNNHKPQELKTVAVVGAFFIEGNPAPCFQLEDGTVRYPYYVSGHIVWLTEEERVKINQEAAKPKIILAKPGIA
jgi:hypothetical protein